MPPSDPTIFDAILAGDIPCERIYEDEHVLAFLDIQPLSRGHVLLIPKQRAAQLHELDEDHAAALGRALPRLARAVIQATGCKDYNVLQNNGAPAHQAVMHVHFHIIPKNADNGLELEWNARSLTDATELGTAIRAALKQDPR
ncbi:MAG TPA: HIT family protein [Planctomycetes bacterium]|nr:HIT family protein [Planctomycetota bacterium]HIL37529.1 HIT family protein [Planctomycetota bacterium]